MPPDPFHNDYVLTHTPDFIRSLYESLLSFVRSLVMLWKSKLAVLCAFAFAQSNDPASRVSAAGSTYLLGVGIGDVTGPIVETNMMGYANLAQTDTGLHMRQRSRAFIVADSTTTSNRIVFINSDIGMGDYGVRVEIVNRL